MSDSPQYSSTGHDPAEKYHSSHLVPIHLTISQSRHWVVVDVGKPIERLVLTPDEAEMIGRGLLRHASALRNGPVGIDLVEVVGR